MRLKNLRLARSGPGEYQPGEHADAAWRCTQCGAPRGQHLASQICPAAQEGDDYAAMFCTCCPACTDKCRSAQ